MATENQINANRNNSQFSTGPNTEAGKSTISQNALKTGLFSRSAFIRPDELPRYNAIHEALSADLAPNGPLEENLVTEIIRASWRLERCADVEAAFLADTTLDPMANDNYSYRQNNVDRARAQSHRIIMRTLAELRRLQTERQARQFLEKQHRDLGVASALQLVKAQNQAKSKLTKQSQSTQPTNHPANSGTSRNAPCPCNSGRKFKHCCARTGSFVQAA
jgi:SEC-C motif